MRIKPQRRVLVIWRLLAVLLALVPAFLLSLFLPFLSLSWIITNAVWILVFLYYFLYHLPTYYKNLTVVLYKGYLSVHSGVLYANVHTIPCQHVQYITQSAGLFNQLFHLVSLRVVMAGGQVLLPGLSRQDADELSQRLTLQMGGAPEHEPDEPDPS